MRIPHGLRAAAGAVAGGGDPNFANVSLLLHCNGSDGSTTFTDSSSNGFTVTANGDAKVDTTIKKFGTGSLELDGTGDYLSVPHNSALSLESGDFTVEAWIYRNAAGALHNILNKRTNDGWFWRVNAGDTLTFAFTGGSAITSTSTVSSTTWFHVACTRSGNTVRQFIDGVLDATTVTFTNGVVNTQELRIGVDNTGSDGFNGYIDDLRITKGVARYTANFTPPIAAFPDS